MNRPWCICEDNGTCMGCMIEQKITSTDALREVVVSYFYGTEGVDYYRNRMSDSIFIQENPEIFIGDKP